MTDGKISKGILYKPENFDPSKKYPLLLTYYEQRSDELYHYQPLEATGDAINIPWFVSRGYLVFVPDIHYRPGHTGESALNSVVAAARFLSKKPWVDGKRLGIQGHSFGGFETNYLVTHTVLFAAAAEAAGVSDMISGYDDFTGNGKSKQFNSEMGQYRIRSNLWERPDLYLENSPVLKANLVTTPLLLMNNKNDGSVSWRQGLEFFTALRRLGKRAWLLQYDEGEHVVSGKDAMDYTIRLTQFFDHYLKGAPPPKWMTVGVPASRKGIDTGLELDLSGKEPEEQEVLYDGKIQKVSDALKNKAKKTNQLKTKK